MNPGFGPVPDEDLRPPVRVLMALHDMAYVGMVGTRVRASTYMHAMRMRMRLEVKRYMENITMQREGDGEGEAHACIPL